MNNSSNDIRLSSNSSDFENRNVLFWGFDRASIKRTSLYKNFVENDRTLSFKFGVKTFLIKNELLTQTHKDVLEALLIICNSCRMGKHIIPVYSILKVLEKSSKNVLWLCEVLEELQNVNFRYFENINDANSFKVNGFRIIDELGFDASTGFLSFSFSPSFLAIYDQGKVFNYSEYTPLIASLDHDITKQVVRYLLTYDNLQINIKKLLSEKLCLLNVVSARSLNRYVSKVKSEKLEKFGIYVKDDNICINRSKEVSFLNGASIDTLVGVDKVIVKQSSLPFFDLD